MIHALDTIVTATFFRYFGCLIERTDTGYKALDKEYATLEEAKAAIDTAFTKFNIK